MSRARSIVLLGLAACGAPPLSAQIPFREAAVERARPALDPADSARLRRTLEGEQARFERVRRNHLPWAWGGGAGPCDERIGRFCLSHGDRGSDWEPPPEDERITAARDRFLGALEEATTVLPGDGWVAGQRVRYLVEAGRLREARRAATGCTSESWWCAALEGFAAHYSGAPVAADSAFSRMLRVMPPAERREWRDVALLLDRCAVGAYRRLDEGGREVFEDRFWRLADPFHTRPGNETRSEHFARHVWNALQDRARSAEGISWGDDLREILLRYGWPQGWERVRERQLRPGPPSLVSHYADTGRDLLPPCEVVRDADLAAGDWDEEARQPRTGYALPMPDSAIRWMNGLRYQIATFRRDDSVVVVAAYEIPPDSLPEEAVIEAGLALLTPDGGEPSASAFPGGGRGGAVAARTTPGQILVSVEAIAPGARRATRVREGLRVPPLRAGLLSTSDLLLLDSPDELPETLADAVPRARRGFTVRRGERLGVYWEIYGLSAERAEALRMSLRLVEEDGGWLRRLGRSIGLVDRVPPVRVRWDEAAPAGRFFSRSLSLQIPTDLRPGTYSLELSVVLPGRDPLVSRRRLRVEEP